MMYKTIVLDLIQEQPELHEQLRASRTLLQTLDTLAGELKASHEAWTERYCEANPGQDRRQIAAETMEPAIEELRARMPSESSTDEAELMIDGAMAFLRLHTPPA